MDSKESRGIGFVMYEKMLEHGDKIAQVNLNLNLNFLNSIITEENLDRWHFGRKANLRESAKAVHPHGYQTTGKRDQV